ncbi:MAG: rhodanese-like domain-containing protein [Cyanobacteria bacterium P01_H01_bin.15]
MNPPLAIPEISVADLGAYLQQADMRADPLQLVDVREPSELTLAALPGFMSLPLSQYESWATDIAVRLDPTMETWVLCHHGVRSEQMCYWLQQQGFTHVKNIAGGIDAYARRVDPQIPLY